MSDFNIQFFSESGSAIDPNMYGHEWGEEYAESDAYEVNIWDEDNCIATLFRKDEEWIVGRVDPFYAVNDDSLETDDYLNVAEFIERLESILETV